MNIVYGTPSGVHQRNAPVSLEIGAIGTAVGKALFEAIALDGATQDAVGRTIPWWTQESAVNLRERRNCLKSFFLKQYSQLNHHPNVLTTILRTRAGLSLAERAYRLLESDRADLPTSLPGWTPSQLIYLGFAQTQCQNVGKLGQVLNLQIGNLSSNEIIVNAVVENDEKFKDAYSCPSREMHNKACSLF